MRPRDVEEARQRIEHFVGYYNFKRTHQGIDGLIPADIYFDAESEVRRTMEARVAENALSLAKDGAPAKPFYLSGRVGDQSLSLHAEGEKVVLTRDDGSREEVEPVLAGSGFVVRSLLFFLQRKGRSNPEVPGLTT